MKNWTTPILSLFVSFCQQNLPQQFRTFKLPKLPTVAQKTVPMFACFWKIPLLWDADIIQSYIADSHICKLQHLSLNLVFGSCDWIKAHEVLDQTKNPYWLGQFFESLLFSLSFACYTPIDGKEIVMGTVNNVMWLYVYQFGLLKLFQQLLDILPHTTMKSISTAQHSAVSSLIAKSRPGQV